MNVTEKTNNQGNRLPAIALIGIGLFILFSQIFNFSIGAIAWPLFVILPGLPFLYFAITGGKYSSGLIFPGLIISGTGAILMYQNTFNHFESWAYIWALYPVFIGMGMVFNGKRMNIPPEVSTGRGMIRYGLITLVSFAILFEVFIFQNVFGGLTEYILPLVLIGVGVLFLNKRNEHSSHKSKNIVKRKHYTKNKNDDNSDPYKRLYDPSPEVNPELQRKINEVIGDDEPETV